VAILPIIRSMRSLPVLAELLGVLILALTAGFATGGCGTHSAGENVAVGRPPTNRTMHSREVPAGAWVAVGEALVVRGIANESAGDVLNRRWLFRTACDEARCRAIFLRNSAYGIQRAVLIPHHGYYTATFGPIAVGCKNLRGLPGRMRAHFKLWWSSDRSELIADERAVYGSDKCRPPGTSRTRWTATRWAPNNLRRG
jgi:hypothetical protein